MKSRGVSPSKGCYGTRGWGRGGGGVAGPPEEAGRSGSGQAVAGLRVW